MTNELQKIDLQDVSVVKYPREESNQTMYLLIYKINEVNFRLILPDDYGEDLFNAIKKQTMEI